MLKCNGDATNEETEVGPKKATGLQRRWIKQPKGYSSIRSFYVGCGCNLGGVEHLTALSIFLYTFCDYLLNIFISN